MKILDVEKAILSRRSVRSYKDEEIPRKKLEDIIDKVRMAPSAKNRQDWKFVIVDDGDKKRELCDKAVKQSFVKEAPALIAGVNTEPKYRMSCGIPAGIVDVSIALDHLTLKAAEEKIGTCWIGSFDQVKSKKILNIPDEYRIVALMSIGYPKREFKEGRKNRKPTEEIISYNRYSE